MTLLLLLSQISEEDCVKTLKTIHLKKGVVCKECGHTEHYWKSDKKAFECKKCKKRKSIKVGTLMEGSKLPINYWVITLGLILLQKCTTKEIQYHFNIRYQTIHNLYQTIITQLRRSKTIIPSEKVLKELSSAKLVRAYYYEEILEIYLEFLSKPYIEYK